MPRRVCQECGESISTRDEECPECGASQEEEDEERPRRRLRRRYLEPHRGSMIMVMGILSIFMAQLILGPLTWYFANQDLEKIRRGVMDPEGESQTSTGKTCGIIGTIIGIVGIVLVILWMILIFTVFATAISTIPKHH